MAKTATVRNGLRSCFLSLEPKTAIACSCDLPRHYPRPPRSSCLGGRWRAWERQPTVERQGHATVGHTRHTIHRHLARLEQLKIRSRVLEPKRLRIACGAFARPREAFGGGPPQAPFLPYPRNVCVIARRSFEGLSSWKVFQHCLASGTVRRAAEKLSTIDPSRPEVGERRRDGGKGSTHIYTYVYMCVYIYIYICLYM